LDEKYLYQREIVLYEWFIRRKKNCRRHLKQKGHENEEKIVVHVNV
jgi:hypothetical protein